jgi:hypothetical protein
VAWSPALQPLRLAPNLHLVGPAQRFLTANRQGDLDFLVCLLSMRLQNRSTRSCAYRSRRPDQLLGICFLRGALEGAVEGIGDGEKGGCSRELLTRLDLVRLRHLSSLFLTKVFPSKRKPGSANGYRAWVVDRFVREVLLSRNARTKDAERRRADRSHR